MSGQWQLPKLSLWTEGVNGNTYQELMYFQCPPRLQYKTSLSKMWEGCTSNENPIESDGSQDGLHPHSDSSDSWLFWILFNGISKYVPPPRPFWDNRSTQLCMTDEDRQQGCISSSSWDLAPCGTISYTSAKRDEKLTKGGGGCILWRPKLFTKCTIL